MKFYKPKFWDYKRRSILSYLLLPFTFPLVINNFFFKFKKKNTLNQKTRKVCIGNIYVGGTGKTPLVIKIYKILKKLKFKTATIKKYYRNHVDEQELLNKNTKLYCQKKRSLSLHEAIKDDMDVVIFDDGLQDRSMNYDLKFVCFNNKKWIGNGQLIPAGPLREKIESITKYDAVFLNGNENDNSNLKLLLKKYNKDIKIFETNYHPINTDEFDLTKKYVIFSGIGNPESFKQTLIKKKFNIIKEIHFPDHYNYTQKDIDKIKIQAKNLDAQIITTEKDYIKINPDENDNIKFLKIELEVTNEDELINYLQQNI
ncbi:tetraacyldisaccharide 4'-kinase [Pelagibacterales bacterium SAG-MED20]|nr:tetraacyldisaccharide 4'-kinase [Pelagibacterales bacterium SAG-MED20]